MDAAVAGAISAVIVGILSAVGVMYGSRGANRVAREASAVTGYDSLTKALVAERDKAEADQAKAEARVQTLELEIARLRLQVQQLGGAP